VIVDAFEEGLIDDALIVPVSVNYEKLVDGNFVREQMGTPKRKESFRKAISSIWKVLNAKYGQMRIDFNEPFSLKELVKTFKERKVSVPRPMPTSRKLLSRQSINSAYGIEVNDKHRALVDNIGRHVVYDCCAAMSVMSTNIVAFLLLNKHRNGATLDELALSLTQLREQIGTKRDFGFNEPSEKVVIAAIEILGTDMVERTEDDFIAPILSATNVIELFYYSNTFVPYFALDAAVTNAIATALSDGYSTLTMNDVIDATLLYCDILRYEFIFHKPCQNFSEQIEMTVHRLREIGVVTIHDKENVIELNLNTSEMLLSALAAFNITYWLTAECLCGLLEKSQMLENDFIKMCIRHITEKFESRCITYGEAISTDSIKNCLKLLEKWAVVEVDTQSGVRIMSLTTLYNSQSQVQSVVDKLERFVICK
jgi:glycerol-3-phosphate O-acyltransferase 1/2